MEIIKLSGYKDICDEIHFEIKNKKLEYVDFFSNGKLVFKEFKSFLTGHTLEQISIKIPFMTINPTALSVLKEFQKYIEKSDFKQTVRSEIFKLKNK